MGGGVSKDEMETAKKFYSLNDQEVQRWMTVFKRNTSFGNRGRMTKENFDATFNSLENGKRIGDAAFRMFDWDKNGSISFNEFMFAMLVNSSVTPKQKLCYAFDMLDINGDGEITLEEMRRLVREIEQSKRVYGPVDKVPDKEIARSFRNMDENGDGSLTRSEFVNQARNHAGWLLEIMYVNV